MKALVGRTFVHPFFDYLFIGGGLSLVCTILVYQRQNPLLGWSLETLPWFILLSNSAHFAASTVRLYTKPGTFKEHPYLTMAFPLVSIVLLVFCIALPLRLGVHLQALYLTWSPYHYAAQAYGLAVIYCIRSGCSLTPKRKKIFRATCALPFLLAFLSAPHAGLGWLAPSLQEAVPPLVRQVLIGAVFLLPIAFFVYGRTRLFERLFLGNYLPRPAISGYRHHIPRQGPERSAKQRARRALSHRPLLSPQSGARLRFVLLLALCLRTRRLWVG